MTDTDARKFPDLWLDPENDPRVQLETGAGEKAVVLSYLEHYRMTFELKCAGLDAEQLARRAVPPSTMSLLGLVRHLAGVENTWFQRVLSGADRDAPRLSVAWREDDRDWDFNGALADEAVVAEAWDAWHREVTAARAVADELTDLSATVTWREESAEVRDILVHMVEEYARHLGHADLLRECIDGRTGQ